MVGLERNFDRALTIDRSIMFDPRMQMVNDRHPILPGSCLFFFVYFLVAAVLVTAVLVTAVLVTAVLVTAVLGLRSGVHFVW